MDTPRVSDYRTIRGLGGGGGVQGLEEMVQGLHLIQQQVVFWDGAVDG